MGQNSKISWTNDTWNPWQGCRKVSPGCKNCYMYRDKRRYGQDPVTVVKSKPPTFTAPLTKLKGPLVFVCSWSDFFIEDADPWRTEAWDIIRRTPHLTYQILTKRPGRIADCLPPDWGGGWPNVWLGVSIESQKYDWRIDTLNSIPAVVRFVSYEPALGPIDWSFELQHGKIDWLISGGESGPKARPADKTWFRKARDQCLIYNVPYFHKQHGGTRIVNGVAGGCELDGQTWLQFPQREQQTEAVGG